MFRAAEALKQCGPLVTLQVLKDAANRQGLSALLAKPSENHHHHQPPQQQQLARFPATSNPSLLSHQQHPQIPSSTIPLKTTTSHERLLTHHNGQQHHHHHQQFATLAHPPHHHHQQQQQQIQPSAITQPRPASRSQMPNPSSSYEFVYNAKSVPISNNNNNIINQHQRLIQHENQHRLIQPARSAQILIDEETNEDLMNEHATHVHHHHHHHQHQSNPNLFHSNQNQYNRNQTFDVPKRSYEHENHLMNGNDHHHHIDDQYEEEENHHYPHHHNEHDNNDDEDDLQPTNFIRQASERQSFGDRNLSTAPPLVYREDVPPNQNGYTNGNHQMKPMNHTQSAIGPAIAPKPLPKPMMSTLGLIKQTNTVNSILFRNIHFLINFCSPIIFRQMILI